MIVSLKDKLKNRDLTKMEQKIAAYLSEDETRICFLSATEIASTLGISDASVIRFAKNLGYSGFNEMKKEFQGVMASRTTPDGPAFPSPAERFSRVNPHRRDGSLVDAMLDTVLANLRKAVEQPELTEKLDRASRLIMGARRKVVVGFRGAAGIAYKADFLLGQLLPNVYIVDAVNTVRLTQLLDLRPEDCLIVFYFPRYSLAAERIIGMAHEVGVQSVIFCDRPDPGVAGPDDIVLTAGVDNIAYNNSYTAAGFLVDLLGAELSRRLNAAAIRSRLERIDDMSAQFHLS